MLKGSRWLSQFSLRFSDIHVDHTPSLTWAKNTISNKDFSLDFIPHPHKYTHSRPQFSGSVFYLEMARYRKSISVCLPTLLLLLPSTGFPVLASPQLCVCVCVCIWGGQWREGRRREEEEERSVPHWFTTSSKSSLRQESATFFYKWSDSKYFGFCKPQSLSQLSNFAIIEWAQP